MLIGKGEDSHKVGTLGGGAHVLAEAVEELFRLREESRVDLNIFTPSYHLTL